MEADVVIIGSGPAGLQAAIHAARKKVSTVLIGKLENSSTFEIPVENYFGTPGKQSGTELLMNGVNAMEVLVSKARPILSLTFLRTK